MFFVVPKREKPIICLSRVISGSESIFISFLRTDEEVSAGAVAVVEVVVVVVVFVELSGALAEGARVGRELGVLVPL